MDSEQDSESEGTLANFLQRASDLLERLPQTHAGAGRLRQLAASAKQPFNLAVVGRMKTGKSTLINALLERELTITDVEEATATQNWLCYGTGSQIFHFIVHWKDGRTESFPVERLKTDWSGKSSDVKVRAEKAARLQMFSDAPKLREIQIIDTPGTGSAVEIHESAAQEFLNPEVIAQSVEEGQKADAILYVVSPIGRETDVDNLALFGSERMPNSGPYNSVCVLHKWDALDAPDPSVEMTVKADKLRTQFQGMVAEVIPVSGPIALAARVAKDEFFERLLAVTGRPGSDDFESLVKTSDRWDREIERAAIRKLFPLPWASFRMIARQLRDVSAGDIPQARQKCLEYSRIGDLEKFVEERFFSQRAIIKRCQILEKVQQIYAPSARRVESEIDRLDEDAKNAAEAAANLAPRRSELSSWLNAKSAEWRLRQNKLYSEALSIDRDWGRQRREIEAFRMDLRVSEAMDQQPTLFPLADHGRIRALCDHLATRARRSQLGQNRLVTLPELRGLIDFYRVKADRALRKDQPLFEHVVGRLEEASEIIKAQ